MTNETSSLNTAPADNKRTPFGARLRSAREAMGLERKDVATQLRLNEKIIVMMEKDRYPVDLPVTFIRGYLRSYAKFLQIPEFEIKKGIEPIKPKASQNDIAVLQPIKQTEIITSGNYFMQFFTYLITFTMLALAGMWWYTHPAQRAAITTAATSAANSIVKPEKQQPEETQTADASSSSPASSDDETPDKLSVEGDQPPTADEESDGETNVVQVTPSESAPTVKKAEPEASSIPDAIVTTPEAAPTIKPPVSNSATTTPAAKPKAATTPIVGMAKPAAKPAVPVKPIVKSEANKSLSMITTASSVANVLAMEEASAAANIEAMEPVTSPVKQTAKKQQQN
jgi:cytoskeleton protein RodZ